MRGISFKKLPRSTWFDSFSFSNKLVLRADRQQVIALRKKNTIVGGEAKASY